MATARPSGALLSRAGLLRFAGGSDEVLWVKASGSADGGCVEVTSTGSFVFVQDSKSADGGPVIALSRGEWSSLLSKIRSSE